MKIKMGFKNQIKIKMENEKRNRLAHLLSQGNIQTMPPPLTLRPCSKTHSV